MLAWAFGDFEYVEEFTQRKYNGKPLPVRVYTTRGLKSQALFGLKNAHEVVDYFSEVRVISRARLATIDNACISCLESTTLCQNSIYWQFMSL